MTITPSFNGDFDLSQVDYGTKNAWILKMDSMREIEIEEVNITQAKLSMWQCFVQSISTYGIAGATIVSVGLVSCFIILSPDATQDDKNWARTTATSMATGVVGFLFGKQQETKRED